MTFSRSLATVLAGALAMSGCTSESERPPGQAGEITPQAGEVWWPTGLPAGIELFGAADKTPDIPELDSPLPYSMRSLGAMWDPVLAVAPDGEPRSPDRVIVCGRFQGGDPYPLDPDSYETVDVGGAAGYVIDDGSAWRSSCPASMGPTVVWAESGWILSASAVNGDAAAALEVARTVDPSRDSRELQVTDADMADSVVGSVADRWALPEDPIVFEMKANHVDSLGEASALSFDLTIQAISAQQRGAILGRMLDDPGPVASTASAPVYDESFGPSQALDVDGATVWVGGWSAAAAVAVAEATERRPALAVVAAADSGGSGSYGLPTASQLARIAAGVGVISEADADAQVSEMVDRAWDSALLNSGFESDPTAETVVDDWGQLSVTFRRDRYFVEAIPGRVYLPQGWRELDSESNYIGLDTPSQQVGVHGLAIPSRRRPTLRMPTSFDRPEASGYLDVVVTAQAGTDIAVAVGDQITEMPMRGISDASGFDPAVGEDRVAQVTTGERWGHLVVDARAFKARDRFRSTFVVGTRDGTEVFRLPLRE